MSDADSRDPLSGLGLTADQRAYIEALLVAWERRGYYRGRQETQAQPVAGDSKADEAHNRSDFVPFAQSSGRGKGSPTLPRGMPEMLIEAAYRRIAPQHAAPIQITEEIKASTGTIVPETSLHRVIKRLVDRGVLERVGNTAAFRLKAPAESGNSGVIVDIAKRGGGTQ